MVEGKSCHLPVNDSRFAPTAGPSVDSGNSVGGQKADRETGRRPDMPTGQGRGTSASP